MFVRLAVAKIRNSCDQHGYNAIMEDLEENSHSFFIFTAQHFSWLNICRCFNKTGFCWLIFLTRKETNNLKF